MNRKLTTEVMHVYCERRRRAQHLFTEAGLPVPPILQIRARARMQAVRALAGVLINENPNASAQDIVDAIDECLKAKKPRLRQKL